MHPLGRAGDPATAKYDVWLVDVIEDRGLARCDCTDRLLEVHARAARRGSHSKASAPTCRCLTCTRACRDFPGGSPDSHQTSSISASVEAIPASPDTLTRRLLGSI